MALTKNSSRAWACCFTVTAVCMLAQVFSKKYSPVVSMLMEQFDITLTMSSLIVSAINLGAVVLAIPSGYLASKFGVKKILLAALAMLAGGGIISVLAPNYAFFLGGRLIEGFGLAFTMVLGPAVMVQYFTSDKVGMPMGIQATWSPIGTIIALNVGTIIVPSFGWQGMWWFTIAAAVVLAVLVWFILPKDEATLADVKGKKSKADDDPNAPKIRTIDVFKNPAVWCLAFIMFGYTFINQGVTNYGPLYLTEAAGYTDAMANLVSSMTPAGKILGALCAGAIMLKLSKPKLLIGTLAGLLVIASVVWFYDTGTPWVLIVATFVALGFVQCFVPPTVNATVPDVLLDVRFAAVAMGVVITIQKLGSTIAAPVITAAVDATGTWVAAGVVTAIAVGLSTIAAIILFRIAKKNVVAKQAENETVCIANE